MGALPKQKISRSQKGNRRSHHSVNMPQLAKCPNCKSYKELHHVCPNCGMYKGRQVLFSKDTLD